MDAVVFGLFGVIARMQAPGSRARIERIAQLDGEPFWNEYWGLRPSYDRGEWSGREYWHTLAVTLHASFTSEQVSRLIAADVASWSDIDCDVLGFASELAAAGPGLGVLANIPEDIAAHFERTFPWLERFTVRGFSCRLGRAKPESGVFRWCCQEFGLAPGKILLVDDRRENVLAARALGMQGHVFTSLGALRRALGRKAHRPTLR